MKDRVVEFPHRYQLVPVLGQSDTYDIVAKPGTVTEVGTPLNKATLLKDETATLYDLTGDDATVDKALWKVGEHTNIDVPPKGTPLDQWTWEEISRVSGRGSASEYFSIGDEKEITLSTSETLTMQICDFNHDVLSSDGVSKAGITLVTKHLMSTKKRMNATNTNVGGWGASELRGWLQGTLKNQLPSELQSAIKSVTKFTGEGNKLLTTVATTETIFLLSEIEVVGHSGDTAPGEGYLYPVFSDNPSRIKKLSNGAGIASRWWQRSPANASDVYFRTTVADGTVAMNLPTDLHGIAFGFCV